MTEIVKSVFEMDDIKFTLFLRNNGLGHFEQKYSFIENGYFWRFCHRLLKGDNFCRQEFGFLIHESLDKETLKGKNLLPLGEKKSFL